jgi:hypothetical protein
VSANARGDAFNPKLFGAGACLRNHFTLSDEVFAEFPAADFVNHWHSFVHSIKRRLPFGLQERGNLRGCLV